MLALVLSFLFFFTIRSIFCGSCGPPEVPKFMKIVPDSETYANGSSVYYFCGFNKVLIGHPLRTCHNGNWVNRMPQCANYHNNITLTSITHGLPNTDEWSTIPINIDPSYGEYHAYYVKSSERPQKCTTFRMNGTQRIHFNFTEEVHHDFIKMILFIKSKHNSNENLIKSIKDNKNQKNCEIVKSENFYEVLCRYQHNEGLKRELLIQSTIDTPIDISLCQLDLGAIEKKCGKASKPIGSQPKYFNNFVVMTCDKGLELIGDQLYKCNEGEWKPHSDNGIHGYLRCINASVCNITELPQPEKVWFDAPVRGKVKPGDVAQYNCIDDNENVNYQNEIDFEKDKMYYICKDSGWKLMGNKCFKFDFHGFQTYL